MAKVISMPKGAARQISIKGLLHGMGNLHWSLPTLGIRYYTDFLPGV